MTFSSALLLWYFIHNSKATDFCKSYANNEYNIGYSFGGEPSFPEKGFLVIDENYWKFAVDFNERTINLASNESTATSGFGKAYKVAFGYTKQNIGLIDVSIGHRIGFKFNLKLNSLTERPYP